MKFDVDFFLTFKVLTIFVKLIRARYYKAGPEYGNLFTSRVVEVFRINFNFHFNESRTWTRTSPKRFNFMKINILHSVVYVTRYHLIWSIYFNSQLKTVETGATLNLIIPLSSIIIRVHISCSADFVTNYLIFIKIM